MSFDVNLILAHLPAILQAAGVTALTWTVGMVCGLALGLAIAIARFYGGFVVSSVLRLIVEIVRGTPFLVQLFLLYFGGPAIGLSLDAVPAGLLALSVFAGCYFSEVFRTGLRAVPAGHIEAATCTGMTKSQILRRIMLPEMLRLVLPPAVNIAVGLIKETAVLSVISVPELTATISAIGSESYAFVEALFLLCCFYWLLVELCAKAGRLLERRLSTFGFVA